MGVWVNIGLGGGFLIDKARRSWVSGGRLNNGFLFIKNPEASGFVDGLLFYEDDARYGY